MKNENILFSMILTVLAVICFIIAILTDASIFFVYGFFSQIISVEFLILEKLDCLLERKKHGSRHR